MTIITRLAPAAFLAQVRKQAAQSPAYIPNALMDSAAEIIREWATVNGLSADDAAYIAGWVISHVDMCPPEYAAILDAAQQFGADCAAAGMARSYAERNFGAVIAYAATGTAQVEF